MQNLHGHILTLFHAFSIDTEARTSYILLPKNEPYSSLSVWAISFSPNVISGAFMFATSVECLAFTTTLKLIESARVMTCREISSNAEVKAVISRLFSSHVVIGR